MPNLHGFFAGVPYGAVGEAGLTVLVAGAVWLIARRGPLPYALAALLVGGVLVSYHAYEADCAILLPGLLAVGASGSARVRVIAIALLLPLGYALAHPLSNALRLGFLVLLAEMAWECRSKPEPRAPATPGEAEAPARLA